MATFTAPQIPRDTPMPETTQTVLLVLMAAMAAVVIAYLVMLAWRTRDPVPVYLLIGGALAIAYEPLGDSLVLAYYPEVHQETWVSLFGRDIPAFTGLLYFWYMCPFVILFRRIADAGFTASRWWTLVASSFAFVAAYEIFWMAFDNPWLYYGHQSMVIADLPLHVPFTYTTFLIALGSGIYGLTRFIEPKFHWLVIPAVPVLLAGSHAAASLPAATALYSTNNGTLIWLGSMGSIVLSVLIWWTVSMFFVRPRTEAVVEPVAPPEREEAELAAGVPAAP
jgi:hypothetical protein